MLNLNPIDYLDRLVRGDPAPPATAPAAPRTPTEQTGPRAQDVADAIGLLTAQSAPPPVTTVGRLGLPIQFAPDVPRSPGPVFIVSIPDEATRRLDAIKARERGELARVATRYRGIAVTDPRFYHERPLEARAIQDRYRFDVDAVDTQAAYAVAVAVEAAWSDTITTLRGLYPGASE